METSNSYITKNIYSHLSYKVYRNNGTVVDETTLNPFDRSIGGCTDYGASVLKTDEEVIKDVDKIHRWSYLQIMDEDNMLCREISIFVGKYGYTIRAIF
jgi:hypothetical protein